MLELLEKIGEVNGQLLSLLKMTKTKEKDEFIDKLNQLLDAREHLINNVKKAQTIEEKQLGDKLIKDNEKINELLNQEAKQIKREINQFYVKKKNNQRYDNPYLATSSSDGIFIDKKN